MEEDVHMGLHCLRVRSGGRNSAGWKRMLGAQTSNHKYKTEGALVRVRGFEVSVTLSNKAMSKPLQCSHLGTEYSNT